MASLLQGLEGLITTTLPTAEAVGQILLDVEVDEAVLAAGGSVPINVQIATVGGKAVRLQGSLVAS
jgi:hypothetical protein